MKKIGLRAVLLFLLSLPLPLLAAPVTIAPDGGTDTYALFQNALSPSAIEVPDCAHPSFGPHIRQEFDSTLGLPTFAFQLHVTPDNDRCMGSESQRVEVKIDSQSPEYLKIREGDTVRYRWRFRLADSFQISSGFTYIHQIKAYDGDNAVPLVMLDARTGSGSSIPGYTPNALNLVHADSAGSRVALASTSLASLQGEWVEAYERVTAGSNGSYALTLTRVRDGAVLLNFSSGSLDLWRSGSTFLRPKWGLYRGLSAASSLRDDQVNYQSFCLAKAPDDCAPPVQQVAAPVFSPAPGNYASAQSVSLSSATAGATLRYTTGSGNPSCSSGTVYSGPRTISSTTTVRAIACRSGLAPSTVSVGTYTISANPAQFVLAGSAVSASAADSGFAPANAVDGDLATRWNATGTGQYIQFDLGAPRTLSFVRVAWYRGNLRRQNFSISVSANGSSFTPVFSGQSSGTTTGRETYNFTDVANVRHVRITGLGNTENNTIGMLEAELFGLNP